MLILWLFLFGRFSSHSIVKIKEKILKVVFDLITSPLGLPIAWYWEYLIIWGVSKFAYIGAFALVGRLYDSHIICGSLSGSICHWIIRLVFFILSWAIIYGLIVAVNWAISNYILILSIIGCLFFITIGVTVIIRYCK